MDPIITPKQAAKWLENKPLTIIDVRSNLQQPDKGEIAYQKSHLPQAFYLHLEKDLSGPVKEHGGNHPLPPEDIFIKKLQNIGVEAEKPILIYDTSNDMFAARAWWLIHAFGHEHVYILDGGYDAWVEAGYEVTDDIPKGAPTSWEGTIRDELIASMEEVKDRDTAETVLIDSRAKERYLGNTEPLYKKAGHIPGAKNYFWQEVLQHDGTWKNVDELAKHFSQLDKDADIIVSCGSGISACPNYIALKQAGYKHVRLYPGSYSDWISYEENAVHKGEE